MKRLITLLVASALFAGTASAQQDTRIMQVFKNGAVVFQSAVADIDSIIFFDPVTNPPQPPRPPFDCILGGSEYFVIFLDPETRAQKADRIVSDFSPNDMYRFLWLWESSYDVVPPTGHLNFFGRHHSWISLQVGMLGWSGKGYFVGNDFNEEWHSSALAQLNKLSRIMENPEEWYFHIAIKSNNVMDSHLIILDGSHGTRGRAVIGQLPFEEAGMIFQPHPNARILPNGEWHSVLIPMTYFMNYRHPGGFANNLRYSANNTNIAGSNIFVTLSGGRPGTRLEYDAVFFIRR